MGCLHFPAIHGKSAGRTHFGADAAQRTLQLIPKDLPFRADRFWIRAPFAFERTSFEKHGCPDTRAIMDAKFLNI
jgi:hypothetical protein